MENARRKERDTSAKICEEGSLMALTKLRPPLLREDDVGRGRLIDWLRGTLRSHRLILISAAPDRLE